MRTGTRQPRYAKHERRRTPVLCAGDIIDANSGASLLPDYEGPVIMDCDDGTRVLMETWWDESGERAWQGVRVLR